eukprot:SAG31_NODE_1189_length_9480_cov_19.686174_6_plen_50_part_00
MSVGARQRARRGRVGIDARRDDVSSGVVGCRCDARMPLDALFQNDLNIL